jgi:sugar/nucleoside kinase (ribokinase family)
VLEAVKTPETFHPGRRGVLAGGNWIVDHVKAIDVWPAQDTLATIRAERHGNGGGPYNLLKNLALMECGFPLSGVGRVGRDADGDAILRDCDAHGIDRAQLVPTEDGPTSYTDVMTVEGTGRRTFFHQHGANALLAEEHFDLDASDARFFYLGYLCLLQRLDAVETDGRTPASRLLEKARASGMTTAADLVSNEAASFEAVIRPSLPHLDYLFLNEYELARLVNEPASEVPAQLETRARRLLDLGVRRAVLVHLPQLALCVQPGQPAVIQPSVRVPRERIAGTAGAGDAFATGVLFGLYEGWEMGRCLELGACMAAASLRDATCSGAIESWTICLEWGRNLGFHPLP